MKDHEEINAPKSNIHVPRPPSLCSLHPLARAAQLSYEAMQLESHTHRMHIVSGTWTKLVSAALCVRLTRP